MIDRKIIERIPAVSLDIYQVTLEKIIVRLLLDIRELLALPAAAPAAEPLAEVLDAQKKKRDCFITIPEAARFLDVDTQTILKYVRNLGMPFHVTGGDPFDPESRFELRFTKRAINKWLEKKSVSENQEA